MVTFNLGNNSCNLIWIVDLNINMKTEHRAQGKRTKQYIFHDYDYYSPVSFGFQVGHKKYAPGYHRLNF